MSFEDNSFVLEWADAVLAAAGFTTVRGTIADADIPWILAEDRFFALGVVAADDLATARRVESLAVSDLLDRVSRPDVGAKRWDAYLVLLIEESIEDVEDVTEAVELQYNTRGVRRLVSSGTIDQAAVARALRPFLPLPTPFPGALTDSFSDLSEQLIVNGIAPDAAERYVAAFSQRGDLDDV